MPNEACPLRKHSGMATSSPYLVVCPALLISHWFHETNKFSPSFPTDDIESNEFSPLLRPVKLMDMIKTETDSRRDRAPPACGEVVPDKATREVLTAHETIHACGRVLSSLTNQYLVLISYTALRNLHRYHTVVQDALTSRKFKSLNLTFPQRHMFNTMFNCCVLDEGHVCRNSKSLTTLAVYAIQASHRLVLTGTPLQNTVEDIWAVMQFVLPDYLGSVKEFQGNYVIPIRQAFVDSKCSRLKLATETRKLEVSGTKEGLRGFNEERVADEQSISKLCVDSNDKKMPDHRTGTANKLSKAIDIAANGLNLLRKLHSQVRKNAQQVW